MPQQIELAQQILAVGRRLAQAGLVSAHSGNISCRLADGSLLITASGVGKGSMTEADILHIDAQGRQLAADGSGRRPSTETALHVALYQQYPHIQAIVHAHPPYATALATAGRALDWQMLEESRLLLGLTPLLARLEAGSAELAATAAQAAAGVNALLLAAHGAISWGENLDTAACRMEILEHTARVMLYKGLFQGQMPEIN